MTKSLSPDVIRDLFKGIAGEFGRDPFSMDGQLFIRKSDEVPRGLQAFYSSREKRIFHVDHISTPHPELAGICDTFVLNPLDYEVTKKSMMEAPALDRARDMRKRSFKELQGFDTVRHVRESMGRRVEETRGKS